jgi:hypothetical protein
LGATTTEVGRSRASPRARASSTECVFHAEKPGHRSRDCWNKGKGKGKDGKGKGYGKDNIGYKGGYTYGKGYSHDKGKGKGIHSCEPQAFAPQPQPVTTTRTHDTQGNQLMTTSWNGYAGNFGGINLCCLTSNRFAELAEIDEVEVKASPPKSVRFHDDTHDEITEHGSHDTHDNSSHDNIDNGYGTRVESGKVGAFGPVEVYRGTRQGAGPLSPLASTHAYTDPLPGTRRVMNKKGQPKVKDTHENGNHDIKDIHMNSSNGQESTRYHYTIGDAINVAKNKLSRNITKKRRTKDNQSIGAEHVREDGGQDFLRCLMSSQASGVQNLCMVHDDEYEKVAIMIDSGASETVASMDKFPSYPLELTTASGTTYSSAAEKQAEDIVNMGQKYVQVVDEYGVESWAKFQMCKGLGNDKILGSVSRLVEAGHSVVFRKPELGSYIQNNLNGYRTYLRQQNGSYYLDLWVKKGPGGGDQQQQSGFARRGM